MGQCSKNTRKNVKLVFIALFLVNVYFYVHFQENVSKLISSTRKTFRFLDSFDRFVHQIKLTNKNYKQEVDQKKFVLSLKNIKNINFPVVLPLENIQNIIFPVMTIFTTWEQSKEKNVCRNNTLENWNRLYPFIQPILFTNDRTLQRQAKQLRWEYLPVRKIAKGVPILKYMFKAAREFINTPLYAFANGDILFTNNLISTIMAVLSSEYIEQHVLLIGRRTNVYNITRKEALDFKLLTKIANTHGKLFLDNSIDYFITPQSYPWHDIPEVIIGRLAYDNYLVFDAKMNKRVVIDGTETILAVHQTTAIGNFESLKSPNKNYNLELIAKMKVKFNAIKGHVSCANFVTNISPGGYIVVKKRKPLC